jgi:hypothetical protein
VLLLVNEVFVKLIGAPVVDIPIPALVLDLIEN